MGHIERFEAWKKKTNGSVGSLTQAVLDRARAEGQPLKASYKTLHQSLRRWALGEVPLARGAEHVAIRRHVAAVLGATERELFPDPTPVDTARFVADSLPEFGAFDPRRDDPPPCAWVARPANREALRPMESHARVQLVDAFNPDQKVWFHAPPGVGRSFVCHWHQHHWLDRPWRSGHPSDPVPLVLSVTSVEDAVDHRELRHPNLARPVVIRVQRGGGEAKAAALLQQIPRCLLFSPAPLPPALIPHPAATFGGFQTVAAWQPDRAWRAAFVRWLEKHLPPEEGTIPFELQSVLGCLDVADPDCRLFDTPFAVLSAIRFGIEHGENALQDLEASLVAEFAVDEVERHAGEIKPALQKRMEESLQHATIGAWEDRALPWHAARPRAQWNTLLRASTTTPTRGSAKRDRVVSDPAALFIDGELLRESSADHYRLSPPWISAAMVRAHLHQLVCDPDSWDWALHALDPSRQPEVDHALAHLDWRKVIALVKRVLENFSASRLQDVSALESLFLAVGTRVDAETVTSQEQGLLRRLVDQQIALLLPRPSPELPVPRTRAGLGDGARGGARFASVCWRWSFSKLPHAVDASLAWLFPGWSTPSLATMPSELRAHDLVFVDDAFIPIERAGVEALIQLAPKVIARCDEQTSEPSLLPAFLKAAALLDTERRTAMLVLLLAQWRNDHPTRVVLALYVDALSETDRRETLRALWSLLVRTQLPLVELLRAFSPYRDVDEHRHWFRGRSPVSLLTAQLLAQVEQEALGSLVQRDAPWTHDTLLALVARAPEGTDAVLLDAALEATPGDARAQLTHALLALAQARPDLRVAIRPWMHGSGLASHVVPVLWRIDPEGSAAAALSAWRDRGEIDPWMTWFDPSRIELLIGVFEQVPERGMPESWRQWLERQLCGAGPLAERIWALLEREQTRDAGSGNSTQ